MRLKFSINKQQITRTDTELPVNKSHDFLEAEFSFTGTEWDNITKTVLFKIPLKGGKEKSYAKQIPSTNVVTVPWEVLQGYVFKVSVFGGDLITTGESIVYLQESGYTTDITSTTNPSSDIFSELFTQLSSKYDNITFDGEFLNCYNGNTLIKKVDMGIIKPKWSNIQNKPSEFNPSSHNHIVSDINDFESHLDDEIEDILDSIIDKLNN